MMYTFFKGTELIFETDNWEVMKYKFADSGDDVFLLDSRGTQWYRGGLGWIPSKEVPPYILHLQLVLGL